MEDIAAVVLAAGKGTRMKSCRPKVLHSLAGLPVLGHVLDLLDTAGISDIVVVVGHGGEEVRSFISAHSRDGAVETVFQERQLGTGHAVLCAESVLAGKVKDILIICGDTPLFEEQTMLDFRGQHLQSGNAVSVLSSNIASPAGYGRILRGAGGEGFAGIVEEKDATSLERAITEINTGTYIVATGFLFDALRGLDNSNSQGEYYLTDIVAVAVGAGLSVDAFCLAAEEEALGINSRRQLSLAELILLERIRGRWMDSGVTFVNAPTVYVEKYVQLARDVIIEPCVQLKGRTSVGEGAKIGAFSCLDNAVIQPGEYVPPGSMLIEG